MSKEKKPKQQNEFLKNLENALKNQDPDVAKEELNKIQNISMVAVHKMQQHNLEDLEKLRDNRVNQYMENQNIDETEYKQKSEESIDEQRKWQEKMKIEDDVNHICATILSCVDNIKINAQNLNKIIQTWSSDTEKKNNESYKKIYDIINELKNDNIFKHLLQI